MDPADPAPQHCLNVYLTLFSAGAVHEIPGRRGDSSQGHRVCDGPGQGQVEDCAPPPSNAVARYPTYVYDEFNTFSSLLHFNL